MVDSLSTPPVTENEWKNRVLASALPATLGQT
jgi:hypothetical protein